MGPCTYTHTHTHTQRYMWAHAHTGIHGHMYTHRCTWAYAHTIMHTQEYMNTCTHTLHTNTYRHKHTQSCTQGTHGRMCTQRCTQRHTQNVHFTLCPLVSHSSPSTPPPCSRSPFEACLLFLEGWWCLLSLLPACILSSSLPTPTSHRPLSWESSTIDTPPRHKISAPLLTSQHLTLTTQPSLGSNAGSLESLPWHRSQTTNKQTTTTTNVSYPSNS